jgi:threonine dehydratase
MITARDALGHRARIVGVVSAQAPAYLQSLAAGRIVEHPVTTAIADGLACRSPDPAALGILARGLDRIVAVDDGAIRAAMQAIFTDTHQVAEGAGAAGLAAALQERARIAGQRVGLVITGANVDAPVFADVLNGH